MDNIIGSLNKKKYQTIKAIQKGVFLGAEITGVDLSKSLTKNNETLWKIPCRDS